MNYREALNVLGAKASMEMDTINKLYKELLKVSHPDHGGTSEHFQQVRKAFKVILANYKYEKNTKNEDTGEWSSQSVNLTQELQEKLIELFEKINSSIEIDISVMGTWLWVTGDTIECKNTLKTMEFKFSRNKTAWYWYHGEYKKFSKKKYSMSDIASMHGKMDVELRKQRMITG